MELKKKITEFSTSHYKTVTWIMVVFTVVLGAFIPLIKVDTDPENMLSRDEPVRVFHNDTKKKFSLYDIIVLGIINEKDPDGVFNPESLKRIYELTEFAKTLKWEDPENKNKFAGVVEVDVIAPSEVDHISNVNGTIHFDWLMNEPPRTREDAVKVRDRAMSNPLLKGTLVSEDGKAMCLYLPLTSKDMSYKVYTALKKKIAELGGDEQYHITGLPVAEDTFGVEMFIQMAISAPLAMLVIFILMLVFFRKLILIISPMIIAMVSVISTMGLLIGMGYPVHIMSSMIPIFLMPIAVVDSVHILSEFFDIYDPKQGRKAVVEHVMENLFTPMLYTSLTSAAGFASLALTPIPPVQVFGIFVAIGIMIAWVWTVTFVPAYVMMLDEEKLKNFGHQARPDEKPSLMNRILSASGGGIYRSAKPILAVMAIIAVIAAYGISKIQVNDNPVKWFSKKHPIRIADIELNKHFGGTYMAYLVIDADMPKSVDKAFVSDLEKKVKAEAEKLKSDYPIIRRS